MFSKVKKLLGAAALGTIGFYPYHTPWAQLKAQMSSSDHSIQQPHENNTISLNESLKANEEKLHQSLTYTQIYEHYILAVRNNLQYMVLGSLGIVIYPLYNILFPVVPLNILCYIHDIVTRWRIDQLQETDPQDQITIKNLRNQNWWSSVAIQMTTYFLSPIYIPSYFISTILVHYYAKRCDEKNEEGSSYILGLQTGLIYTVFCYMMRLHLWNLLFFCSNFSLGYMTWEMFKEVKKGKMDPDMIQDTTVANYKWFVLPSLAIPFIFML